MKQNKLIVMFHYVCDNSNFKGVSTKDFERYIRLFLKYNYKFVSLYDMYDFMTSRREIGEKTVCFTFDDGLKDGYKNAFSILKKYGIPAHFFITTSPVQNNAVLTVHKLHILLAEKGIEVLAKYLLDNLEDKSSKEMISKDSRYDNIYFYEKDILTANVKYLLNFHIPPRVREDLIGGMFKAYFKNEGEVSKKFYLTWAEMRQMLRDGMLFGSHGHEHRSLGDNDRFVQEEEIARSKSILEKELRIKCDTISYPHGSFDKKLLFTLRKFKFKCGLTTKTRRNTVRTNPLLINRINACNLDKLFLSQAEL